MSGTDSNSKKNKNNSADELYLEKVAKLPELLETVNKTLDENEKLAIVNSVRKMLAVEKNAPIDEVIKAGWIPQLITFLQRKDNPSIQFEAAWALTNIVSGSSEHCDVVVKSGAVPHMIDLIDSPNDDCVEQAIWALGNIAGDSASLRNTVLQLGAIQKCVQVITKSPKLSILRNTIWTISNLCRGKPIPDFNLVAPVLPAVSHLLYCADEEVLVDACWTMAYLSDGPNDRIDAVIQTGSVRRLVELLLHSSYQVQTATLRCIGNIATGNDSQTQLLLNSGALQAFVPLLKSPKKAIRKEACWTISNITAGNRDQIQRVIDANLVEELLKVMYDGDFDTIKEATWAICNATSGGSKEQIDYLVKKGCIKPLCELLITRDAKIICVALEGLQNILESGTHGAEDGAPNPYAETIEAAGGLDKLEQLQYHKSDEVYQKVKDMLETYFEAEADEDAGVADVTNKVEGFSFE